MKEHLNEHTLYAQIALLLNGGTSLALIVEGPDDHLVIKDHASSGLSVIEGTGGREQVLRTARIARANRLERARFLVDRDFDDYGEHSNRAHSNVMFSQTHDFFLDLVLADPHLLEKAVEVVCRSATRRPDRNARALPKPSQLISEASSLALKLSAVRITSLQLNLNLRLQAFSFGKLPNTHIDVRDVGRMVLKASRPVSVDDEVVLVHADKVFREISGRSVPPVGDHDLFKALSRVLRQYEVVAGERELQTAFMSGAAVRCDALGKTDWIPKIAGWARSFGDPGIECYKQASVA